MDISAPSNLPADIGLPYFMDPWDPAAWLDTSIALGGLADSSFLPQSFPMSNSEAQSDYNESTQGHIDVSSSMDACQTTTSKPTSSSKKKGKVSGLSSLRSKIGSGGTSAQLLPGLYIRKDTLNSNFIGTFFQRDASS